MKKPTREARCAPASMSLAVGAASTDIDEGLWLNLPAVKNELLLPPLVAGETACSPFLNCNNQPRLSPHVSHVASLRFVSWRFKGEPA